MSRTLFGCALAGALALTVSVAAQDPPQNPPPQNPPAATRPPMPQDQSTATVTVEGCLVKEADVPGRKPNVAERAGVAEDYVLTTTKMIKGSAPAASAPPRAGETPTGTTGSRGSSLMFDVKGIDKDDLTKHAGQRVQIDGTFQNVDRARSATPAPSDDLVELRGTAIRQVAGECPAAK